MQSLSRLALICVAASALAYGAVASRPAVAQATTLYQQLGGYDSLAAVTDDFIHRLATDPKLAKFFAGVSDEHKGRIRQLVLDQLCAATGGPCVYVGQDMKTVHKGLNISEDDWQATVVDFTATLDKFKVGQAQREQLFAILTKIKPDIVNVQ